MYKLLKWKSYPSTPLNRWVLLLFFLLATLLITGMYIFVVLPPSPSFFISASFSESLGCLGGEKRYWTNEWLESHCHTAAVEKSGWGSSALSWGSCMQERECSWYQRTRLCRLETRSLLPGRQLKSAWRMSAKQWISEPPRD